MVQLHHVVEQVKSKMFGTNVITQVDIFLSQLHWEQIPTQVLRFGLPVEVHKLLVMMMRGPEMQHICTLLAET